MTDQIRVSFTGKKRPDIKIHLMLPTEDGKLAVEGLTEAWARASGYWDGNVSGRLEWDDENKLLLIRWSNNLSDLSMVQLTPDTPLSPGVVFSFHSNTHKTDDDLLITAMVPITLPRKEPTP